MNLNFIFKNNQQKHQTTWCSMYLLFSLLSDVELGLTSKNDFVKHPTATRDYFSR